MRTFPKLLILLIALAVPTVASAGGRGHRSHDNHNDRAEQRRGDRDHHQHDHRDGVECSCGHRAQRGAMTFHNPNSVPLQIKIDRELVGTVAPGDTLRIGGLERGEHTVVARYVCNRRSVRTRVLRERVHVDSRHPTRIELPFVQLAVVELSNRWIEPMEILVDGSPVGTLPAFGDTAFIADSGARIALRGPRGERALRARVRADGLRTYELNLIPPARASVLITNPSRRSLVLTDARGRIICDIPAGATEKVTVDSGRVGLVALHRGRSIDKIDLIASPFMAAQWTVTTHWDYNDGRTGSSCDTDRRDHRSTSYRYTESRGRRAHSRRVTWSYR